MFIQTQPMFFEFLLDIYIYHICANNNHINMLLCISPYTHTHTHFSSRPYIKTQFSYPIWCLAHHNFFAQSQIWCASLILWRNLLIVKSIHHSPIAAAEFARPISTSKQWCFFDSIIQEHLNWRGSREQENRIFALDNHIIILNAQRIQRRRRKDARLPDATAAFESHPYVQIISSIQWISKSSAH